ncbi:MAG: GntR family transcriptional regulator [Alphaproteobacteria bacterium]
MIRPARVPADGVPIRPSETESADVGTVEQTVRLLREGIERGDYAPGQRLVEPDLTRDLGVGRSSLREAFRRLSAEGVIVVVPNRGATVRRLTIRDVREIQQIRRVLEPLAASLAAAAIDAPGNRARFDAAAAIWLRQPPLDDVDVFSRENRRLHRTIVELSGNDHLATIIERLNMPFFAAHFRQRITIERRIAAAAQHRRIALAIRDGDRRAAQKAMEEHVEHSDRIVLPGEGDVDVAPDRIALARPTKRRRSGRQT